MELKDFNIPFIGLKEGIHQFEFEIDSAFFEQFDFSIIQTANFKVLVEFEKKVNMFNLNFDLKGSITANCDRCLEELTIEREGKEELIIKFGEESFSETDEIRIIAHSDHELDITNEVYQYIHLLKPNKIEHETIEECNQEMVEKLVELTTKKENSETDPRWSALAKLKDKSE